MVVVVKPAGATDAVAKTEDSNSSQNTTSLRFDLGFASNAGTSDTVGQPATLVEWEPVLVLEWDMD